MILETKVWIDIEMFRDDCHENEGLWVLHKDEYSLDEGMMNHRYQWTVEKITQPK